MKLKVTLEDGSSGSYQITPKIEVDFEKYVGGGFAKTLRDQEKQEHVYFLAWLCLKAAGQTVKPFENGFLDTLSLVELELDDPNG
jgi:hypothetical protein